ncbi:MAG: hypothetical protein PVF58_09400 [Candidatus Methanofastidiosia archaeon]|jgi:hypothetical protein
MNSKKLGDTLDEVSEIEIKAFSVEDFSTFRTRNLHDKVDILNKLGKSSVKFSKSYPAISLGDAFQIAMNAIFSYKGNVALIVETRVITLDSESKILKEWIC